MVKIFTVTGILWLKYLLHLIMSQFLLPAYLQTAVGGQCAPSHGRGEQDNHLAHRETHPDLH